MPSCEVQRTLVKSPPELWAELSDPASLAKHLGEFGEIRIAHIEPETAVEWEAEEVRGIVQLKASGWGTKVTLTAVRDSTVEETSADEASLDELASTQELQPTVSPVSGELEVEPARPQPLAESESQYAEPPAEPDPQLSAVAQPVALTEPEPALLEPEPVAEPERRPGLFARLFRRRRKVQPAPEPEILDEDEPGSLAPEVWVAGEAPTLPDAPESETAEELTAGEEPAVAEAPLTAEQPLAAEAPLTAGEPLAAEEPDSLEEPQPTPAERPDLAAELAQVEQAMVEQDAALLTAVLDRLGAAHHRPFSRG